MLYVLYINDHSVENSPRVSFYFRPGEVALALLADSWGIDYRAAMAFLGAGCAWRGGCLQSVVRPQNEKSINIIYQQYTKYIEDTYYIQNY